MSSAAPVAPRGAWTRLLRAPEMPPIVLLAVTVLVFGVTTPQFLTATSVENVLSQAATIGVVAVGFGVVMLAGHLDLSVGSVVALAGSVTILWQGLPVGFAVVAAVLLGVLLGVVNGFLVTVVRIPSLIATLATMIAYRGVVFLLTEGRPVQGDRLELALQLDRPLVSILSLRTLLLVAVVVVMDLVMRRTSWGRSVYAIGSNQEAAVAMGIPVRSRTIGAFAVSAGLAALSGSVLALTLNSASPRAGEETLLLVVAAVLVGGTRLTGGMGSVGGIFAGVLLVTTMTVGMNFMRIDAAFQRILLGSVLIAAVVLAAREEWKGKGA